MKKFIKTCPNCSGQDVQVMSVVKTTIERGNRIYDAVKITEICNQCAYATDELHYLYPEEFGEEC